MTVMFEDVHKDDTFKHNKTRLNGIEADEILYADDTICIGSDVKVINRQIRRIQTIGEQYGLHLNKDKCEVITYGPLADIRFKEGDRMKQKDEAKYLGCHLNDDNSIKRELDRRITECAIIWRKLDIFWIYSDCSIRKKIQVYDAIIRTKLLYGME